MERYVIDEHGEIIDTIKQGDRIIRGRSIDALKMMEFAPKEETFTKLYHKIIPPTAV